MYSCCCRSLPAAVLAILLLSLSGGCGEEEVEPPAPPVTYNELVRGCIAATACDVLAYPRVSDCVKAYYQLHMKFGISRMYDSKYHCVNLANGDCDEVARCMGTNRMAGRCDAKFKARCDGQSAVSCDLLDKRVFVHECTHAGLVCAVKNTQTFEASCAFGTCVSGYKTRCEDGKALTCLDGVIIVEDCKSQNMVCGINSSKAKGCVGNTTTSCTPGQYKDKCEGNKVVKCEDGKVHKVDCATRIFNKRCKDAACVSEVYVAVWAAEREATALSYKGCSWSDAEVERFARALPAFGALKTIDLNGTLLGDAGVPRVLAALPGGWRRSGSTARGWGRQRRARWRRSCRASSGCGS